VGLGIIAGLIGLVGETVLENANRRAQEREEKKNENMT